MTKRILIVDDDEEILLMLDFALKKLGSEYEIITVTGSVEALDVVQESHPFDLVVTDYVMKDITGVDLARAVRRISPETPVLLMTAYGTQRLRATTESLGFDGYLDKPFTVQKIRGIVEQMVDTAHPISQADALPAQSISGKEMIDHLKALQMNAHARCVILLASNGYPVQIAGEAANLQVPKICALIAANFMSAGELAGMLGNEHAFRSGFYEGGNYNVYTYDVNGTYLLAVVFEANQKPGVVWFYTKQTAVSLAPLLSDDEKTD